MTDAALFFTDERTVEHRPIEVGSPAADELLVETQVSAISAGTELLVYRDEVPTEIPLDETIDSLDDDASYPVRYGYAAVGTVVETGSAVAEEWLGREVFAFEPHQTRFCAAADSVVVLPETVTVGAGALFPTVETATNIVLDSQPRLGEQVVVFGAGVVGCCTTRLLSAFPLDRLVVVDPLERRREVAIEMGADEAVAPEAVADRVADVDLAIELSGQPDALDDAIEVVGYDSRIVVGSWYGTKRAPIDLGSHFHRDRIELVSSQVSTIAPELRGRWDTDRRTDCALTWLDRIDTERLISHRIPFDEGAEAYAQLDTTPESMRQVLLTYA